MEAPTNINVLLVEDEISIAETILYALRTEGMRASHLPLGLLALERLRAEQFSLAIVDVGLPDVNGFDLCRQIRAFSDIPIIFLTARDAEIDRIVGLEIGADDYVTKPFSPRELAARVRVILRRGTASSKESSSKTFRIDETQGRIYCKGEALYLTRYEFHLLRTLLQHPERVFSREDLMQRIWVAPAHSTERTVDAHIKTLRSKVRAALGGLDPIETHRGIGYSLRRLP